MKKFFYEVLLTNSFVEEKTWLDFIFSISKINGWLKKWKLYIKIENNEIKYFIKTSSKMPPILGNLGDFLLRPTEIFQFPTYKFSLPYYISSKYPCIIDLFDKNESTKNRKLFITEITFLSYIRNNFFSFTNLFFQNSKGKIIKQKAFGKLMKWL